MDIAMEKGRKPVARKNDKGQDVPEVCPKCGSKVGLYFRGEPVWACSNDKCNTYFGTLPFKASNEAHILDDDELFNQQIAMENVVNSAIIMVKKLLIRICGALRRLAMNIKRVKKYYIPIVIKDRIVAGCKLCSKLWGDVVNESNAFVLKSKEIPKQLEEMKVGLQPQSDEYFLEEDYMQVNTKAVVQEMQTASKRLENSHLDALTATNDTDYQVSLMEQVATAWLYACAKYFKFGKSQGKDGKLYDIGQEVEVEFID